MSIALTLLLLVWLAGALALAAYGYHSGLRAGLFHPKPMANIIGWPVTLPFWMARRGARDR